MQSQQLPFTKAKNLILSSSGKRIAHAPPAVKPPDTTDWAFVNLRMSEKGSERMLFLARAYLIGGQHS